MTLKLKLCLELVFLCWCSQTIFGQNDSEPLKDLNVMAFLPMTGNTWPGGRAVLPALNIALREVNARSDVLPGFKLNMIIKDSVCEAGRSMNMLYDMLYTPPVKMMIVGPACSLVAAAQAEAVHYWNLSHLSYGALSPVLSDKKRFPRFFRILPPDTRSNSGKVALIRNFQWKKVATITVAIDFFTSSIDDLVRQLKEDDIQIISQEIYDNDPTNRIQNLKNKDARIIIAASYEPHGRLVMCAAYREGLYGPKIVWIFPGWYNPYWWRSDLDTVPCTRKEMDTAAEGHFLATTFYINPKEDQSIGGLTAMQFEAMRKKESDFSPEAEAYGFIAPSMYDTVWGTALALNCTMTRMKQIGYNKTLDEFDYSDGDIGAMITDCLSNLNFMGVTGTVRFDETGEPLQNIRLEQIQDQAKIIVGRYVLEEEERYLEWFNGGIHWHGGVVPRDSTEVTMVDQNLPPSLYIPMSVFATLGNILAVGLLTFNIIYRKHTYVKLSSPNINNVVVCGCLLTYSSVYMYSNSDSVFYCKLRHFIFTTGFTMAFGAMFSKTWRVYKIFCNKKLSRVKINDLRLLGIVVVMVVIMLIILVIWEAVDALVIKTLHLQHMAYNTGTDAIAIPVIMTCTSRYYYYFLCTMCIVEGAMLAFGAFLSFETRKVRIEALNDARQIGLCLYNVIVLSVLVLILSILLDNQIALVYGIFSGFVILGTTATLLIIFIPKILSVFHPNSIGPSDTTETVSSVGFAGRLNRSIDQKTNTTTTQQSVTD